jgi:hypothetical protein
MWCYSIFVALLCYANFLCHVTLRYVMLMCDVKKEDAKMTHNIILMFWLADWQKENCAGPSINVSWQLYCQVQLDCTRILLKTETNKACFRREPSSSFCPHTACSLVEMRWSQMIYSLCSRHFGCTGTEEQNLKIHLHENSKFNLVIRVSEVFQVDTL